MNSVSFTGRLSSDPDIRYSNEICVARFSIAVQRDFRDKDGNYNADFFDIVAFRKQAEFIEKYCSKGTKIEFCGKAQRDSWTDKDGKKMSRIVFIADRVAFAESKAASASAAESTEKTETQSVTGSNDFIDVPADVGEELPFN